MKVQKVVSKTKRNCYDDSNVQVNACRFGGLLHDWPESYFKAQQTRGDNLAGVFKQAMEQMKIQKVTRTKSILARMFSGSPLARLKSMRVRQHQASWQTLSVSLAVMLRPATSNAAPYCTRTGHKGIFQN